jgi:hypothetical protein
MAAAAMDEDEESQLITLATSATRRIVDLARMSEAHASNALSMKIRRLPQEQRVVLQQFLGSVAEMPEVCFVVVVVLCSYAVFDRWNHQPSVKR